MILFFRSFRCFGFLFVTVATVGCSKGPKDPCPEASYTFRFLGLMPNQKQKKTHADRGLGIEPPETAAYSDFPFLPCFRWVLSFPPGCVNFLSFYRSHIPPQAYSLTHTNHSLIHSPVLGWCECCVVGVSFFRGRPCQGSPPIFFEGESAPLIE